MKKRLLYVWWVFFGYAPFLFAILALLFVWFVKVPYFSKYYYYDPTVYCCTCETLLETNAEFCQKCGGNVENVGTVIMYKHCSYCVSTSIYREEASTHCTECGKALTRADTVCIGSLGFSTVRAYRNAVMRDNLARLVNNKIMDTAVVILLAVIGASWAKSYLLRKARNKIIKEGLRNS